MPTSSRSLKTPKVSSFQALLRKFESLETRLDKADLPQFALFNQAYLIVTQKIAQAAVANYFNNPRFIETFSICFATYYFEAVDNTMANNPNLPTAWQLLQKPGSKTPHFIYLLMGANAHINHDLPLALAQSLHDASNPEDLFKDVLRIDRLLMKAGREIVATFEEPSPTLNFLKRKVVFLYYRPIMYIILYWRARAWHNYRRLQRNGPQSNGHAIYATRIAKRFVRISGWF